jgi:hypothetical protein
MLTLRGGYGKKIYPDSFVADIVRRMHEDSSLTAAGLYRKLIEEQVISSQFHEWQIEAFVNGNPRFRSMFLILYGEKAYTAWKSRFKRPATSAVPDKPPMDFSGFRELAIKLAIHTRKSRTVETQEEDEEEDYD